MGLNAMCKIMEDVIKEEREKNIKRIAKMISKGYSKEEILDVDYTEEYEEAEKELIATV